MDAGRPELPPENHYGHTKKLRYLVDTIEARSAALARPVRVLDFGCGNGAAVSRHLAALPVELLGVDVHEPSLEHARANYAGPSARFESAVPPGETFDVVVYADFLEHVHEPGAFLGDHAGRLREGGIVVGSIPNGYGPFELEQRLDKALGIDSKLTRLSAFKRKLCGQSPPGDPVGMPYNHDSGHVVFFTRARFERCVRDACLQITDFRNGAFVGASLSGIVLARSPALMRWNTRVAEHLPHWAVSTWYFTLAAA